MTKATVKWFNPTKGFGFAMPADGSADAYLHVSVVEQAGYKTLPEGTVIDCYLSPGKKGQQVEMINEVLKMGQGSQRPRVSAGDTVEGTVKWFDPAKKFGFVTPDVGGKDVFVHLKAIQKSGQKSLQDGQRVRLTVEAGKKGPLAQTVELLQ